MTAEEWWRSGLQQRYSLYCNRALATICYARLAAANITDAKERANTIAFLEEQKGTLFLEQVQNAPPMYNQMQKSPKSADPQYRQKCLAGLEAFQQAQRTLKEEWEFQLCIAKLLRKLGGGNDRVLYHLAMACHLAKEYADGSVESMYQLHATRLKLLQESQPNLPLLHRHCFLPETRLQLTTATRSDLSSQYQTTLSADAAPAMAGSNVEMSHEERAAIIFQDAMSAMKYCLEQSKTSKGGQHETFHKARYRRAQALRWQGRPGAALTELQPCFKSRSKQGFAINMFVIPEGVKRATKVGKTENHSGRVSCNGPVYLCTCLYACVYACCLCMLSTPNMRPAILISVYAKYPSVQGASHSSLAIHQHSVKKAVLLFFACHELLSIMLMCHTMSRLSDVKCRLHHSASATTENRSAVGVCSIRQCRDRRRRGSSKSSKACCSRRALGAED